MATIVLHVLCNDFSQHLVFSASRNTLDIIDYWHQRVNLVHMCSALC